MQIMFLDEYYLLFVKYMQEKNALRYPGTVLGIGQSFLKKFTNVEMFTMKNNTIIVTWFLCDVQNYAESEVGIILFNLHNLSHRTLPHSIDYVLV